MPYRKLIALSLLALLALAAATRAGDILRGGAAMSQTRRTATSSGANAGADAAAKTAANAKDRLSRTTAALDAVKAMQLAARNAANAARNARIADPNRPGKFLPRVKDGLGKNGLQVAALVPKNLRKPKPGENPALWTGANLPTQTTSKGGQKNVVIVQTDQQALLTWETFNIGRKTSLYFDQSAGGSDKGKWIAFNKINDPKGRPSQILGQLKADGQVYVINQNGVIFGGSSQVNTHTLVAAALPINNHLIASGLLNNPSAEFLFSAVGSDAFDLTTTPKILGQIVDPRSGVRLTYTDQSGVERALAAGTDYTTAVDDQRNSVISFTAAGAAKIATAKKGTSLTAKYDVLQGNVTVEAGAQLTSPTSAAKVGGRIMLAGANVKNAGTISTPDGQTILAAGSQLGMAAHSGNDPSLRGVDVFVGEVADFAGRAVNSGLIDAPRASVLMTGKSVQQNGVIHSTTSVSLNGRVDLVANYGAISNIAFDSKAAKENTREKPFTNTKGIPFLYQSTGVVTLGEGSVTEILPEWSSLEKVTGTELALPSQINVQGLAAHFDKDSILWAPNAEVTVNAGNWHLEPATDVSATPLYEFVHTAGQIYVDKGAVLDVAGSTAVSVPLDENILTLELRGSELADSPLQRGGALRGVSITIDARETGTFNGKDWIGTPLGDASGFLGIIERGVGQLTATGGSVDFQAGDSVVMQSGSSIDVSGGWFNNQGGLIKTTKVVQGAQVIDISAATPDQVYDGIYDPKFTQTHSKWGVAKTYHSPFDFSGAHFESDYVQGANGGSISIVAPSMALDGKLTGNTVIGPKQIRKNAASSSLPDASKLALTFRSEDPDPVYGPKSGVSFPQISLHPPEVVFGEGRLPAALPFALDADGSPLALQGDAGADVVNPFQLRTKRRDQVVLSPTLLTEGGFGDFTVDNAAGDIYLPAGIALVAPNEGELTFRGRNIDIEGEITAPGGKLSFTAYNLSPYITAQIATIKDPDELKNLTPPVAKSGAGRFTLGAGARLSTAGAIVDDRGTSPDAPPQVITSDGGTIGITAYRATLEPDSLVDVSGGVLMTAKNELSYGDAGSISINAGLDPGFSSLFRRTPEQAGPPDYLPGGRLFIAGELRGYAGGKGGSLALQAPFIQVGGVSSASSAPGTLFLKPEFFNQGGFGSFSLTGIGGTIQTPTGPQTLPAVVIAENTVLAPQATSLFVDPLGTDAAGGLSVSHMLQTVDQRTPVSLSFNGRGVINQLDTQARLIRSDVVMESGAVIRTDPLANVSFKGDTVAILGSVSAPAGKISISGGENSLSLFGYTPGLEQPTPTVYIGSETVLSAAGTTVRTPNPFGHRTGTVLPGGSIDVSGNIVAARGAVLDVSGASEVFDLSPLVLDPAASPLISARSGITAPLQKLQTVPVRVDSDAGSITLAGGEELFTDATLIGRAGGPTALGGSLSVSSGRFYNKTNGQPFSDRDTTLIVTQSTGALPVPALPSLFAAGEQTAIGRPVLNADGEILPGIGRFAADTFLDGGFDSLELKGVVRFKGPVDIAARGSLKVADGGVLYADDKVNLSASYIAIGQAFKAPILPTETETIFSGPSTPFYIPPTFGPGVLTLRADLIDIGNLSLQNIRRANFIAQNGDIRGAGTLDIAGHLRFEAGQIYTPTALSFTVVAYDYKGRDYQPGGAFTPGSVQILSSGTRQLPFSAGGTLSFYASEIEQSGVLRAPFGTINLGWDGTGTAPADLVAGDERGFPVTRKLLLGAQSITSVSAVDPSTGEGALIPYGVSLDGNSWIDPRGVDVTAGGLPTKNVNLSAARIVTKSTSQIDLRGGGDLYAYRWVAGLGGSSDILASEGSFAVLPGYAADYAPVAAFNSGDAAKGSFSRDPADPTTRDFGYVNAGLSVGDKVYLGASSGLPAGTYTLLPARYALLPGAFLVTPKTGSTLGTLAQPNGATLVSGYRFNDLNSQRAAPTVYSQFEVASEEVVRARAQYDDFLANRFLRDTALALNAKPQPLPIDSGHLVFQATEAMRLNGMVRGDAPFGGRGAFIDVSSPADIVIAGAGAKLSEKDAIVLRSSLLSSWGAESLLVGGIRRTTEEGTVIDVQTGNLTVDNAGSSLSAPEIILVADKNLTVTRRSEISQSGDLTDPAESLTIDGDGTLLRVSSDPLAEFARINVTASKDPKMTIGANAIIAGGSITLDSTYATDLSPKAFLRGVAVNLNSGQISLRLDDGPDLLPTDGLVLAGRALRSLQSARSLSLLSYSSIDIYGAGEVGSRDLDNLELHAGEIRGFNTGGVASFRADHVLLDNSANGVAPGAVAASSGALEIHARTLELGDRRMKIDQFANVKLNASSGVLLGGKGRLLVDGELDVKTPAFFADGGASETIRATGDLQILAGRTNAGRDLSSGLGASLTLEGASVIANADISLPSGLLTLHATTGDLDVNGRLDVGGTAQAFNDLVKYTDGGEIKLLSDAGDVNFGKRGTLSVAAQKGGGSAGSLSLAAPEGSVRLNGALLGQGGAKGHGGSFSLDTAQLPELAKLSGRLNDASFDESRSFRVRQGDVLINGVSTSRKFQLSADQGSIVVTGKIDASGATGGTIGLAASGDVVLADGSLLDASGEDFSNAGKGGAVTLEAGSQINGVIDSTAVLDIQSGSTIDLSVASVQPTSSSLGQFTGTLHLRAPQNAAGTDLQVAAINGTIKSASNILVEGYKLYDLTATGGLITTALKTLVKTDGNAFAGAGGTTTAGYTAMLARLLANNSALDSVLSIRPGAELINRTGDITLGTINAALSSDWDFETYRFGPKSAPGVLTMRAAGDLVFYNALHDGFRITNVNSANTAQLLPYNPLLPANSQSWSYRLTAGADFGAADFHRVQSLSALSSLGAAKGSLLLGRNSNPEDWAGNSSNSSYNIDQLLALANHRVYQVIRTGSGDIDIAVGRDLQLRNPFATIYTAGTRVADPTLGGTFDLPNFGVTSSGGTGGSPIGPRQQPVPYPAQYSVGGGNVSIVAQHDITHLTIDSTGNLVADSERELPTNWLYRRGYVDPATGEFGLGQAKIGTNDFQSTSWWVDFSTFFEGVGALGGGDVTMIAGNDVANVDAVAPTNARMPKGQPDATKLVELGGGDIVVRAGHNIDGGVYYVERGHGTLDAGNEITTNATRSPSLGNLKPFDLASILPAETWLPTTLFLGKGTFDVAARGNLLLGPVANPFLLPGGINNGYFYKSYFSTYAPSSAVNVTSLGGLVTLREKTTLTGDATGGSPMPLLQAWAQTQLLLNPTSAAFYYPWLRSNESSVSAFGTAAALMPPTLRVTAFTGDIDLVGGLTLAPASRGTLEIASAGSINGLQSNGLFAIDGADTFTWGSSVINVSDASPASLPGISSPFAYQSLVGAKSPGAARTSQSDFLSFIDVLFQETGATDSVLETKQALHAAGPLHADDPNPLRLYALGGDISGITLFSPKAARVIAGQDVTDVGLYIQNIDENDLSIVAAGRDLVLYNANSTLRSAATQAGNILNTGEAPLSGDIQVSGLGTLEVFAGHNLDLGTGGNNADGTGTGISTVGNARSPYLPFDGASIIAGAGIGPASGLGASTLDFDSFIDEFLSGENGERYLTELGVAKDVTSFADLRGDRRDRLALEAFYLVLRDAGRSQTAADGKGGYATGFDAIQTLFATADAEGKALNGNITTRSRDIRTKNGGDISLFAPAGELTLSNSVIGNPLAPPGIVTETGGNISIFTDKDVDIGIGRIFTLRGGNEIIWSSQGNIAAGSSSKTVKSAPPTRVLVDPQSADVQTDLAGLATGGGIGVLATVAGVPPGDVDLIAPNGFVDAGDAGIRVSGNLNIAAVAVLNASNIAVAGTTSGVPTAAVVAAPNIAGLTSASNTAGAANQAAESLANKAHQQSSPEETPSVITVEVVGYGGDDGTAAL